MTLAAAVLMVFIPSNDVVVLKESARVSGRFVRLADLVETGTAAEIYLGRSPEEGRTRVVTVEEIRRELERRGMEPEAVTFVGKRIEVTRGEEPPTQELRRALALEIKRRLLEKNPDDRAEEIVVRIVSLRPENVPPQCRIVDVRERGVLEFSLGLVDSEKNAIAGFAAVLFVRFLLENISNAKTWNCVASSRARTIPLPGRSPRCSAPRQRFEFPPAPGSRRPI